MIHLHRLASFLALTFLIATSSRAQFNVTNLRLEHMENPSTVDVQKPRFSWVNEVKKETLRGQSQSAYQIGVSSSLENLKKGKFDVWDSGKQKSTESSLVPYDGPALKDGADYYWKVRTWNQKGKASKWSEPAQWGMGLPNEKWTAKWIDAGKNDGSAPMFRKGFSTRGAVKQAKAFVCGLGYFELYVNGERIGDDCLVPNMTDYSKRFDLDKPAITLDNNFRDFIVLYLAYDVTKQLQEGRNALGVLLGNGFYNPDKHIASRYGDPCLRLQLEIIYEDGTPQVIETDGTWKTKKSAIHYNGLYKGELYDANYETPDWATADCRESNWSNANVVKGPGGRMTAQTSPADKITLTMKPKSLRKVGEKKYEVDFGTEIAGWIHFHDIVGKKGDTLRVNYVCESPQGIQQYVFKGVGKENYAPRFTWFAFSKATITGVENLVEENLVAEAVNTDVHINSEFECSNELFNQVNTIWRRSQLDNMHGCIASDCPHRERLPYTGDGEASAETVMLNFDASAFYGKWIRDMRNTQNVETGYEPNSAPWEPGAGGGVAWGAAMTIVPWQYYVQYGDTRLLNDSYFAMKEQVRYMLTWLTPDGIMFQKKLQTNGKDQCYWLNLGDWCPPNGELPRDELVHTFYLWLCTDYMAQAANALGNTTDEAYYRDLSNKVRNSFNTYFYNAEKKSYGQGGSNIYALRMGVPADRKADVVATLKKEIADHKGHINTGFLCTKYFFETLADNGMVDLAYEAMNKRDFPSYGWWIEQGATVTWEQWNGQDSHNHPMFGSGLTWLYRRLAGVETDAKEPGYRHIVLKPYLTDLERVRYALQTPYGKVISEILQQKGSKTYKITIPVGSYATLILPTVGDVSESEKTLEKVEGVSAVTRQGGFTTATLQQGTYNFTF